MRHEEHAIQLLDEYTAAHIAEEGKCAEPERLSYHINMYEQMSSDEEADYLYCLLLRSKETPSCTKLGR